MFSNVKDFLGTKLEVREITIQNKLKDTLLFNIAYILIGIIPIFTVVGGVSLIHLWLIPLVIYQVYMIMFKDFTIYEYGVSWGLRTESYLAIQCIEVYNDYIVIVKKNNDKRKVLIRNATTYDWQLNEEILLLDKQGE